MGATGRPRSNAVGVCRARASYQRAQQRRRQRAIGHAIGLKNAVEGQKDRLFKISDSNQKMVANQRTGCWPGSG
jgi:hypothetical protein